MQAKKHLGQHFLTSQKALFDMVTAGDIHENDLVLEIGPGKGVLTKELLEKDAQVIAIEKDIELLKNSKQDNSRYSQKIFYFLIRLY
jgi:16S rRNA (adenine1518-N6/adenine1519-N6)-dimethyltransferase